MKVENLVPEVYYKESRDFAYIGRLFEVLFNYMKTAADSVSINIDNENIEGNLVDLFANTLGFDLRHPYINKDLVLIASEFSTLLKKKGTIEAINLAVQLLLNSQGVKYERDDIQEFCNFDNEKVELNIYIPDVLVDIVLLEDLFDYILPVGITYSFSRFSLENIRNLSSDADLNVTSDIISQKVSEAELGQIETVNVSVDTNDAPGSIYTGMVVSNNLSTENNISNENS